MRKVLLIAMVLVVIQAPAQDEQRGPRKQEHRERTQMFQDFSPEEIAALHTKRMTLALDLTKAQQDKIYKINLENVKARKAKKEARKKENGAAKRSKEERLQHMNEKLDRQIAVKKKMKAALDAAQYEKWSERSTRRGKQRKAQKRRKKQ